VDVYDKATRSRVMRQVKSQNTKPEMTLRRLLHARGFRYRLHRKDLPGTPDLVFGGRRKVVFVHGCLWHQHPGCRAADRPASNRAYWDKKLGRNVARDGENREKLAALGWASFVVWECELRRAPDTTLAGVVAFLNDSEAT